jgi:hypothetical protein
MWRLHGAIGIGGVALGLAVAVGACGSSTTQQVDAGTPTADAGSPLDAGSTDAGGVDAGTLDAGGFDAGTLDGGPDGGTDAGSFTTLREGQPLPSPSELITPGNGLSQDIIDAQHDASGNMWAVDSSHLYVRRNGTADWQSFNSSSGLSGQEILSVGGGTEGVAWVGYKGIGDGDDTDPEAWRHTGGADKAELSGNRLAVTHYELTSPPGTYSQYPNGRYKLRRTLRVYPNKTGLYAGNVWFGSNHGTALVTAGGEVLEHHHPILCVWDPMLMQCADHIGDVPALAFTPMGDIWFGGTYGVGSLQFSDGKPGGNFWGSEPVRNTSLFAQPISPNQYGSEDITGVAVAPDGTIWAASQNSGLAHRLANGMVEIFQEAQGLPSNHIEDLALDSNGGLWMATTEKGIVRLDLSTGTWQQAGGLPSAVTRRVMFETTSTGSFITAIVRQGIAVYQIKPTP